MNTNKKKSINEKEEKFSQEYLAFCSVGTGDILSLFYHYLTNGSNVSLFNFKTEGLYRENKILENNNNFLFCILKKKVLKII